MKLIRRLHHLPDDQRPVLSIAEAVDHKNDDTRHYDKVSHGARAYAESTSKMLGALIEILHAKGVLNDDDVEWRLLDYDFERVAT